jgi:hypothetical protein
MILKKDVVLEKEVAKEQMANQQRANEAKEQFMIQELEYEKQLFTNFENKFNYESLSNEEKSEELAKLYKFHKEFILLAKNEFTTNGDSGFFSYLTKYYAIIRVMTETYMKELSPAWMHSRNEIMTHEFFR